MKVICFMFVVFFILQISPSTPTDFPSDCRAFLRRDRENTTTTYIHYKDPLDFEDTIEYCNKLNGKLPMIHTQEDIDFLVKTIPVTCANGYCTYTLWLGLKSVSHEKCSDEWLDGSGVTFNNFKYWNPKRDNCTVCLGYDCCTLYAWIDRSEQVAYTKCEYEKSAVCIVDGDQTNLCNIVDPPKIKHKKQKRITDYFNKTIKASC